MLVDSDRIFSSKNNIFYNFNMLFIYNIYLNKFENKINIIIIVFSLNYVQIPLANCHARSSFNVLHSIHII